MSYKGDLVSRRDAIEAIEKAKMAQTPDGEIYVAKYNAEMNIQLLPSVQPDHIAESDRKVSVLCGQENDLISRKAAIDAVEKSMYENPHENEIHRGMHDHEHRHFLTILMGLPSARPATSCSEIPNGSDDTISRQVAIDALARMMPRSYTPDGSHPGDEEIFRAQEIYADCIESIEILPAVQPEIIRCKDCKYMIDTGDDLMCDNAKGWVVATASDSGCVLAERRTDG